MDYDDDQYTLVYWVSTSLKKASCVSGDAKLI